MSSPHIILCLTSHITDFQAERKVFLSEVLPEVRQWCDENQINLQFTDIRWGLHKTDCDLKVFLREISDAYYNNVYPIFLNFSCESIGIVPLWGDAPDSVVKEYQNKLNLSDVEMDLIYNAHRPDNIYSLYVVRDDSFLEAIEGSIQFLEADLISKCSKQYGQSIVRQMPCERVIKHAYRSVTWNDDQHAFSVQIDSRLVSQLTDRLKENLVREVSVGSVFGQTYEYTQLAESHAAFMLCRSAHVRGRADVVKKIEDYVLHGDQDVPLLLLGGAGSGKTSCIAKTVDTVLTKISKNKFQTSDSKHRKWRVVQHYVGALPGSAHLPSLLKRLLHGLEAVDDTNVQRTTESVAQITCSALCSTEIPTLIFIDALDQVEEKCVETTLGWIPRKLSAQVRVVLSFVNDSAQHKIMSQEKKAQELHLMPLDLASQKGIVQDSFSELPSQLSSLQLRALLSNRSSENPLWLNVACDQLKRNPDDIDRLIGDLPSGLLSLLEYVLAELERGEDRLLVKAALCFIHTSATGLLQNELVRLLGSRDLQPPSPFDEKEEKEYSEKESLKRPKEPCDSGSLSYEVWRRVVRKIRPFLRPFGDCTKGKMCFYHKSMSKAVRRAYMNEKPENEGYFEAEEAKKFWHLKLADFFQNCSNVERRAEEYLYHLYELGDVDRLKDALSEWSIFDRLLHEEYSAKLLNMWRKAGGIDVMAETYKRLLDKLELQNPKDEEKLSLRHQHIARILLQAGNYTLSLELTKVALKWEEKELGNRADRLVELYFLLAEIFDERLKLNDFVSTSQIPDLRRTIHYGRKSIELRKTLTGDYHKAKLGLSLMKLAFSLESWVACGGDSTLSGQEALREGNEHIDAALSIFKELKDVGHYAEALMTKGVLAPRGTTEQLKYYKEAMDLCRQVYGEFSLLISRLYINIGIVYEDHSDYVKAFDYFKRWAQVSEVVLGPEHPKTLRAKGVLKEPRYVLVAQRLKERTNNSNVAAASRMEAESSGNSVTTSASDFSANLSPSISASEECPTINELGLELDSGQEINREVEQLIETEHVDNFNSIALANTDPALRASGEERRDDWLGDDSELDMSSVNQELQQAIRDLLQRALGELDHRAPLLQSLLNSLPPNLADTAYLLSREIESEAQPSATPAVEESSTRDNNTEDSESINNAHADDNDGSHQEEVSNEPPNNTSVSSRVRSSSPGLNDQSANSRSNHEIRRQDFERCNLENHSSNATMRQACTRNITVSGQCSETVTNRGSSTTTDSNTILRDSSDCAPIRSSRTEANNAASRNNESFGAATDVHIRQQENVILSNSPDNSRNIAVFRSAQNRYSSNNTSFPFRDSNRELVPSNESGNIVITLSNNRGHVGDNRLELGSSPSSVFVVADTERRRIHEETENRLSRLANHTDNLLRRIETVESNSAGLQLNIDNRTENERIQRETRVSTDSDDVFNDSG